MCYVPDACHNIKLARNTLATYRQLKSKDGVIDWKYLQNLQKGMIFMFTA